MELTFDKKGYNKEFDGYKSYYYAYAALDKTKNKINGKNGTIHYNDIKKEEKYYTRNDKYKKIIKKFYIHIMQEENEIIGVLYRIIEEIEEIEKIMK